MKLQNTKDLATRKYEKAYILVELDGKEAICISVKNKDQYINIQRKRMMTTHTNLDVFWGNNTVLEMWFSNTVCYVMKRWIIPADVY